MRLEEFLLKWSGKGIDFDGHYGYQCMDLYRQFVKEVLGFPQSPGVSGAKDVWETYLKTYYKRFSNTPDGVPQKGDIVIWNKNVGGGFGHIAIFLYGDVNNFLSFDQNWPVGSLCHVQSHNYKDVSGWIRPGGISFEEEITDQTRIPQIGDQEVQQIRSRLIDQAMNLETASNEYNRLRVLLEEAHEAYDRLKTDFDKEGPTFNNWLADIFYGVALTLEGKNR